MVKLVLKLHQECPRVVKLVIRLYYRSLKLLEFKMEFYYALGVSKRVRLV